MKSFADEIGGPLIRIARTVEFHGAVAPVAAGFENAECLWQVHVNEFSFLIRLHGLHVTDPVGMLKHRSDALIRVCRFAGSQSIGKIRIRVEPWAAHLFDDAYDEEGVFAQWIVVLKVDDDVPRRAILRHSSERLRGTGQVRFRILGRRHIGSNAGGAYGCSDVDPLFAERDGFFAFAFVHRVRAMFTIDGNVNNRAATFYDGSAKLFEILRVARPEMLAPGFDSIDVELRLDVPGELLQIHLRLGGTIVLVVGARNEIPKGIGSNGNSFAWIGGKTQSRAGGCSETGPQTWQQHRRGSGAGGLGNKNPARGKRQSNASLAD